MKRFLCCGMCESQLVDEQFVGTVDLQSGQSRRQRACLHKEEVPADSCKIGVCCFDHRVFEVFDDQPFPVWSAYIAAASASGSGRALAWGR